MAARPSPPSGDEGTDGCTSESAQDDLAAPLSQKGQPWTQQEHCAFLNGLKALGRGNWRGISKGFVPSRTPTQVASHAQKHFLRQQGVTKRKSRFTHLEKAMAEREPGAGMMDAAPSSVQPGLVPGVPCMFPTPLMFPGSMPLFNPILAAPSLAMAASSAVVPSLPPPPAAPNVNGSAASRPKALSLPASGTTAAAAPALASLGAAAQALAGMLSAQMQSPFQQALAAMLLGAVATSAAPPLPAAADGAPAAAHGQSHSHAGGQACAPPAAGSAATDEPAEPPEPAQHDGHAARPASSPSPPPSRQPIKPEPIHASSSAEAAVPLLSSLSSPKPAPHAAIVPSQGSAFRPLQQTTPVQQRVR